MTLPSSYPCGWCGKDTEADEYVINFGVCTPCLDTSYEQYIEEQSGPFEWVAYQLKS